MAIHSRTEMVGAMFAQMQAMTPEYDFLLEQCDIAYENHSMIQTASGLVVPDKMFVRVHLEFIGIPNQKEGGETK